MCSNKTKLSIRCVTLTCIESDFDRFFGENRPVRQEPESHMMSRSRGAGIRNRMVALSGARKARWEDESCGSGRHDRRGYSCDQPRFGLFCTVLT